MRQNIRWFAILAVVVLGCVLLAGCSTPSDDGGQQTPPPTTGGGAYVVEDDVTWSNNQFAADLYRELAAAPANSGKNIFFSPFSISSALAITYEGARGTTADEIRSVFYFPQDNTVLREGYKTIDAGLNAGDPAYELSTANALWAEQSYAFLPEYIRVARDYYGADATNMDFLNQPDPSRVTINQWVEDQTNDKIKDLLPLGSITGDTRLVITNAVYFYGTWVKQFEKDETEEVDFRVSDSKTVTVEMMQRTDDEAVFGYAETDTLQVLSMPYEGEDDAALFMLVLLPKGNDLVAVEAVLDEDQLAGLKGELVQKEVKVYFPKFRLETEYSLPSALAAMGMPTAFTDSADFSGMDGKTDLFITGAFHKAFVDVNEEGTEAAAATGIVAGLGMAPVTEPIPVFKADHPFIFLIQDEDSGAILFLGRVTDPTA
jgi:serpin B